MVTAIHDTDVGRGLSIGPIAGVNKLNADLFTQGAAAPVAAPADTDPRAYLEIGVTPRRLWVWDDVALDWNAVNPHDASTALALLGALTDASRGLSLGEVILPQDRALTSAEVSGVNSAVVSPSLSSFMNILTNRAAEPAVPDTGVMNADGLLGSQVHIGAAVTTTAEVQALLDGYNGFHTHMRVPAGGTLILPDGSYKGQHFYLTGPSTAIGDYGEAIVRHAAPFIGTARTSQHKIDNLKGTNADSFIIRPGEQAHLVWCGDEWRVISFVYRMFHNGSWWHEEPDGSITFRNSINITNVIGANSTLTLDVPWPLPVTGFSALWLSVTDAISSATGANQMGGSDAQAIYGLDTTNTTAATFRVGIRNLRGANMIPGFVSTFMTGALLDYAAMGGVASF